MSQHPSFLSAPILGKNIGSMLGRICTGALEDLGNSVDLKLLGIGYLDFPIFTGVDEADVWGGTSKRVRSSGGLQQQLHVSRLQ